MNLSTLAEQNPWWADPSAIDRDFHVQRYEASNIKWGPRLASFIKFDRPRIYLLRGPRQVGKTTLLKLRVRELLRSGSEPRNVMYFTCDLLRTADDLAEVLRTYLDLSRRREPSPTVIMIDEVSTVPDWERAVKHMFDTGALSNATMVLTGSHCLELKTSVERLPGRTGEGDGPLNLTLMPMKFPEYIETVRPDIFGRTAFLHLRREERSRIVDALFRGSIDEESRDEFLIHQNELQALFDDYLLTGGLMWPIGHFFDRGRIDPTVYELYIRSLLGDLARWGYREDIAKQVVRSLITRMTTRTSLNAIAKDNELGSHNTVSSYLRALEDSFTVNAFFKLELDDRKANYRGERKLYFTDPFLYHAFRGWTAAQDYFELARRTVADPVEKSKLVEMVVADHLIRYDYGRRPSDVYDHRDSVLFWKKAGSDKEVDFVMSADRALEPLEVKYRNRVEVRNRGNFSPFGRGLTLSKDEFISDGQYAAVPVEYFLLLI